MYFSKTICLLTLTWLKLNPLMTIMFGFIILIGIILFSILFLGLQSAKRSKQKKVFNEEVASIISTAIFSSRSEELTTLIREYKKLLDNSLFRQCLINGLVLTRKDLSGSATTHIIEFYKSTGLHIDSVRKLKNRKWHIKVKGIQELALMKQKQYAKEIFRLTNDENESVRNEAQAALVEFYGFAGLRFLNVIKYSISEWQQILLLDKLRGAMPPGTGAIKNWLQSKNRSVRLLAIKVATICNCVEAYDDIMYCFIHDDIQIKIEALNFLRKYPREDTASKVVTMFGSDNKTFKMAGINALEDIGSEKQISFLLKRLHEKDDDVKMAAAKAIIRIHPMGVSFLLGHLFADEDPWKSIFSHLRNDRAA
jgi:HEAT repeats